MKLIDSYISRNISYPTFTILVILSVIILLTQSLKYIDLVVTHGISSLDFIYLTVLLLPSLLFVIIPICLFIAILYSLNKLSNYRELNVFKSVGISNFAVAKPILKIAMLVTLLHYFIALYWMPEVNYKFKNLSRHLKENYITFFLQEGVFSHPSDQFTFFIKDKIGNNKFENIFFQDRSNLTPITIIAKSGQLLKRDNNLFLNLIDGNRQEINKDGEMSVLKFNTLLWQIRSQNTTDSGRTISIQEKHLGELLFNNEQDSALKKRMFAEANQRIILPIYNIIVTLIAVLSILKGEHNRLGKTRRIIAFSIFAGVILIINTTLINLSANYKGVIVLSYLFTTIVLSYLLNKLRQEEF